ncbi:nuclear inhibitor of protein phosphatase 1 [Ischnura elegans]|uniref:nuclear inhibitor of protein phosphatase 1 n=1 Tax=Ischnura elegans TaxID=197161 RepID=UPI001ED8A75F|nr:nuclear inhibitor of protein phosphatase 1 [Ischnura elegans]
MANHYDIPSWAGKPPVGLHLDVLKAGKLIQKLMIDEKKCYLFGRNAQLNDFCIDHASCSRVHSALVYHKHLHRAFLVDLASRHGTFIGSLQLEAHKPTQLPVDSTFHFGMSTRRYVLRERPQAAPGSRPIIMEELEREDYTSEANEAEGGLLGLPETETELDNLTEFNTAHNRRISMLGISVDTDEIRPPAAALKRKKRKKGVSFNEDEEIINPEDVDPSVGRFRNLVQSTVIPTKRLRADGGIAAVGLGIDVSRQLQLMPTTSHLYHDLPPERHLTSPQSSSASAPPSAPSPTTPTTLLFSSALASKLGLALPNPAPDVDVVPEEPMEISSPMMPGPSAPGPRLPPMAPESAPGAGPAAAQEPRKKKYAKEAWPGKKLMPSLLV